MNFKLWLESTEEEYSNQLTNELCKFIKDNNRLPIAQNTPILGGHTSPTGTRLGYNIEITELKLFQHLSELKNHIRFNSDEEILKANDLENIIQTTRNLSREERSEENLRKVADFYNTNKRYPSQRKPEEKKLAKWLDGKRRAKKGLVKYRIYPNEEQLGTELGLPTNWLDPQIDVVAERNKKISEDNIIKLAEFYQTNNRYPSRNITAEEELGTWLYNKRQAKKGKMSISTLYPGEEELGISLGLPTNWLDPQVDVVAERNKKRNEENLRKVAEFYQTNNRYPSQHKPEEKKLGIWLKTKRVAKKGIGRYKIYPGEEQLGIELGLPTNWLER